MIAQLHKLDVTHHHGVIGDVDQLLGNGVALWFEVDDFDAATGRIRDASVEIVTDAHLNPNAGHHEIWVRDPDGYLVVLASTRS